MVSCNGKHRARAGDENNPGTVALRLCFSLLWYFLASFFWYPHRAEDTAAGSSRTVSVGAPDWLSP